MKKFNILQFVRAIIFLSRGAVCYKLCRNLFLLFLTLFFIQRKNDNQPTAKVLSLPFKIEEKYLSVTESDYQYSYHFISLETKKDLYSVKRPPITRGNQTTFKQRRRRSSSIFI